MKTIKFYRLYLKPVLELLISLFGAAFAVAASLVFVVGIMSAIVAVDALVITSLWPIVIPAMFPNLVAQGFIVAEISFSTAFWLLFMLVVARPANIGNVFSSKKEKKDDKR
jgi:hypothetical protein